MAKLVVVALVLLGGLVSKAADSIDKEAVRKEIRAHLSDVKACYDDAIKKDANLGAGKIVIDFEIDDAGKVKSVKVNEKKTTLKSADVEKCLVEKFNSWAFPASPKGTIAAVSYPFVFKNDKQPKK